MMKRVWMCSASTSLLSHIFISSVSLLVVCLYEATAAGQWLTLPSAPSISLGCAHLKFDAAPDCFMRDAEILPSIYLSQQGSPSFFAANAEDCQGLCRLNADCFYFTFFRNKLVDTVVGGTCLLKPKPSLDNTISVTVGIYDAANRSPAKDEYGNDIIVPLMYEIISGPKECGQECRDAGVTEIAAGCGPTTIGTCAHLSELKGKRLTFDETCATSGDEKCGVAGYKCCRECSTVDVDDCKRDEVEGVLLVGGTDVEVGQSQHYFQRILSRTHCASLCRGLSPCTHFTYLEYPALEALQGGCFLKSYGVADAVTTEYAPEGAVAVSAFVGAYGQAAAGAIQEPSTTTTPAPVDCLEPGVDYASYDLTRDYNIQTPRDCQVLCSQYKSCAVFTHVQEEAACYLKFSAKGKNPGGSSSGLTVVSGPMSCSSGTAPGSKDCYMAGQKFGGVDLNILKEVENAHTCQTRCESDGRCNYWTYDGRTLDCYLKAEPVGLGFHDEQIAGPKVCPSRRRRLVAMKATWKDFISASKAAVDDGTVVGQPDLIVLPNLSTWKLLDEKLSVDLGNSSTIMFAIEFLRRLDPNDFCTDDICFEPLGTLHSSEAFDVHVETALMAAGLNKFAGFPTLLGEASGHYVTPCTSQFVFWNETIERTTRGLIRRTSNDTKFGSLWPSNLKGPVNYAMGSLVMRLGLHCRNSETLVNKLQNLQGRFCFESQPQPEDPNKSVGRICSAVFPVPTFIN